MVEQARAVIIGGGVGGTSVAYHLADRGWSDIVLVDRAELTSGSTFHSAGLVGQLWGSSFAKIELSGREGLSRVVD
jgi:4-methylaminobutanoate oxidase (formaldehyde-forming)